MYRQRGAFLTSDREQTLDTIPNAETLAAMEETEAMIGTGGGQHFTGTTADFFAMLDAGE